MKRKLLLVLTMLLAISWQHAVAQDLRTHLPEMIKATTDDNEYRKPFDISKRVEERNCLRILVNQIGEMLFSTKNNTIEIDSTDIKAKVKEFLKNEERKENCVEYTEIELPLIGKREVISRDHYVYVQDYLAYNDNAITPVEELSERHPYITEQLFAAYNELRNEFALKEFKKTFDQCSEDEKSVCRIAYPCMVKEVPEKKFDLLALYRKEAREAEFDSLVIIDNISGYIIDSQFDDSLAFRICYETATLELYGNSELNILRLSTIEENFNISYLENIIIGPDITEINLRSGFSRKTIGITVDKRNKVYDSRGNCNAIIETETNTLVATCVNSTIPEGVEVIAAYCLGNIKNIHIPASVKSIEEQNLYNVESITVDKANKVYDSRGNCNAIIETETNTVVATCMNSTIPEGVEVIADPVDFKIKYHIMIY